VLPDPFSAVPAASGTVFIFCAPGLVFGGTNGIGSHFHVFRSRTHFPRYRRRRVRFSWFALQDSISAVPRASGSVFMFCAPGTVFGGTEASGPVIMFCAPGLIFSVTEGVGCGFHFLRSQTRFLWYRRRRFPFCCFALPNPFWAVPMASGPVFMFCAPGRIFDSTEAVGSRFHILRSMIRLRRYQGCRVPFSCFALPDQFSTVPTTLGPVFMFCAPELIFGGFEGVESRFYVLRSRTRFR
jgi:hypothetical protein